MIKNAFRPGTFLERRERTVFTRHALRVPAAYGSKKWVEKEREKFLKRQFGRETKLLKPAPCCEDSTYHTGGFRGFWYIRSNSGGKRLLISALTSGS